MPDIFDQITLEETSPTGDIFDQIEYEAPTRQKRIPRQLREYARVGSRAAESILGLPSDVLQLAQVGARGLEKGASKIRQQIGLPEIETKEKPPGLPGSQELKEISQKLFGDIVTPQSKTEEFLDEIVSDAAVLSIPLKGRIPFARSLGTAITANLAAEGLKDLGIGKGGQALGKIGTFFLAGMMGRGTVRKFWNQQYKLAEEAIPKRARLDATKLESQLDSLGEELRKGGIETPSQRFVEKPLGQLQKTISDGELLVEDAVSAKRKINELRSSLFDEVKGKTARKGARTKINSISNYLDEALENYGRKNPAFYKHYKAANEAYGGYHQSKRVGNWVKRMLPIGRLGKVGIILAESIFKPSTIPLTTGAYASFKGSELLTRMFKNPTLRQYYGNLLKDGIKENKAGFIKNIKAIENEIKKSDPDLYNELASQNKTD